MEKAHDISIDEPCVAHQAILFIQHGGHFQEDSKKRKEERKKSFVGFEREREEEREQSDARTDRKTTEINGIS